jgi:hypothetical protein
MNQAPTTRHARALRLLTFIVACTLTGSAFAWGNEGHETVGEIATHFLEPVVRQKVMAMLAADTDKLTAHDFVSETTWADRFRDSDRGGTQVHYLATRNWHFVDTELSDANIDTACFGHPAIPAGKVASLGPANDCVVDKINEFATELKSNATSKSERLVALKFLLHFVGDLHQPLHASDAHDAGGNAKNVSAAGLGSGTLHGFWDTQFVAQLGADPIALGDALAAKITTANVTTWSAGTPTDWAHESFAIAKTSVYGKLPKPGSNGKYVLPASYVSASKAIVTLQLQRAGVRLASVLNKALRD